MYDSYSARASNQLLKFALIAFAVAAFIVSVVSFREPEKIQVMQNMLVLFGMCLIVPNLVLRNHVVAGFGAIATCTCIIASEILGLRMEIGIAFGLYFILFLIVSLTLNVLVLILGWQHACLEVYCTFEMDAVQRKIELLKSNKETEKRAISFVAALYVTATMLIVFRESWYG